LDGLLTKVGFIVHNPSLIPLEAYDLICTISAFSDNKTKVISQKDMTAINIPSKNEVSIFTELTIPYKSLITSGNGVIFPDWFVITISGKYSIEGTNKYIPISINGYFSPNLIL
jgi:hypothetical protein